MASPIRFSAAWVALSAVGLSPAVPEPAALAAAKGTLTPEVGFEVASTSTGETSGLVSVSVVLSDAAGQDVTIPYNVGGSATAADATVTPGPLVIPAGQLTGSIDVTILDDSDSEGLERVALTLGAPTGGVLGTSTVHEVVIADDEAPATLAFDLASSSASEGAGTVPLALTLSSARTEAVVLEYSLGGTATPGGVDVSNPSASSLVIPGGAVTASIDVSLIADSLDETDEVLTVDFVTTTNASPGATTLHALTIIDDDDPPSISFSAGSAVAVEDEPMAILGVEL
ncbi:MAG: Calx-beta domain-containing protein, partial [Planctomycetota bacterium]